MESDEENKDVPQELEGYKIQGIVMYSSRVSGGKVYIKCQNLRKQTQQSIKEQNERSYELKCEEVKDKEAKSNQFQCMDVKYQEAEYQECECLDVQHRAAEYKGPDFRNTIYERTSYIRSEEGIFEMVSMMEGT